MLPFKPNYRLAHPENYLFLLSKEIFSGSKYQKNILFNFEKGSTAPYVETTEIPPRLHQRPGVTLANRVLSSREVYTENETQLQTSEEKG